MECQHFTVKRRTRWIGCCILARYSLVEEVYEKSINLHLQAERDMPKHNFAFDQQKYFQYLSY